MEIERAQGPSRGYRTAPLPAELTEIDVAVIGAGAAGLYAALVAAEYGARVLLISRSPLPQSASYWAQGGVTVLERSRAQRLWVHEGRCVGAIADSGPVRASATVLATGGAAALWLRTTNPPGATGSGLLLAHGAGAALADLEFLQFHP